MERNGNDSLPAVPVLADAPAPAAPAAPADAGGSRVPGIPVPGVPEAGPPGEDFGEDPADPVDLSAPVKADVSPEARIRPGSRCKGTVVAVGEAGVIISFGAKVEGYVPLDEFRDTSGEITARVGQDVEVFVERMGAAGSYAALSYRRIREASEWARLEAAHAGRVAVAARVVRRVKGGLRVDIGVEAFLPASQVDLRPVRDLDAWVGKTVDVIVVECERRRSNAVVSRSELLKTERQARMADTLRALAVGEPAAGVVRNITSYGVFVDLGGIDGLIKLTELSYGRVGNPSGLLAPGQEVTARVLRIDTEKERVALSLRAMSPDPWATVAERYAPGDRVRGRVSSVEDYGAFIELESGVEGLVHISEIEWSRRPKHPSKTFSPGAESEAVVLDVNRDDRRISLSFKRLVQDPWDQYASSLDVGMVVEGVVRRVASYGLFVEVVEGIEGLVHVSDLSWDARARNPSEAAREGQQINTVVLHVDKDKRRLSLGLKQLEPDAWDTFLGQHAVGDTVAGVVRRSVKFGSFVELAPGVEGLCHVSQSPKGERRLQPGRTYEFEVLELNEQSRRIGLRCRRADPLAEPTAD